MNFAHEEHAVYRTAKGIIEFLAKAPPLSESSDHLIGGDELRQPGAIHSGLPLARHRVAAWLHQHLVAVLKCAEMSGGAAAALDITTQFANERVQFEQPIASFQAVQHRLVNMLIEVEGLRYLVYEAAWQINSGSPSRLHISMAKTKANKVYQSVCIDGILTHGAIGFTNEMDIGLYHIRSKSLEFELGATDFHREIIASELEKFEPDFKKLWG